MNYTKKERSEYNEYRDRVCAKLGITTNQYNWLRRKGNVLHKTYEDACNGVISYEEEYESIVNPLYVSIGLYAKILGLYLHYQTDPRGSTIYADKQPIPNNNYTQAQCIY